MSDDNTHSNPTLIDHQDPQARWWTQVEQRLLPRIAHNLERRFGDRYAVSPEQAVSSAVRSLLDPEARDLRFESIDDLKKWLYVVAWRKAKDALAKEHLELRVPADEQLPAYEAAVASGGEEAYATFVAFRNSLEEQEQSVLDAKLEEKSEPEIAAALGWTKTGVQTIWKRIKRKARRIHETENEP